MAQTGIWINKWINLFDDKSAVMSAPTSVSNGIAINSLYHGDRVFFKVRSNAGALRTCTIKVWGYNSGTVDLNGDAYTDADGWADTEETIVINQSASNAAIAQAFEGLACFNRIYGQLSAINNAETQVGVDIGFTGEV